MKKFILMIAVMAASVQLVLAADLSDEMKVQNRKIVQLVVEEISKDLPKTIDNYTQFVDITSKDLALIYIFEINTGVKSDKTVREEDRSRMQRAVTQGVCRSSARFLDAQINISYLYRSAKTKAPLFQFDIAQADCI
ncbi:MAG: hypothetical protein WBF77_13355 [Sulfurimonadaceae bacterium]